MAMTRRGFGVAAAIPPHIIRAAAQTAESFGYDSFWVNDTPGGDGLTALAEAAADTAIIRLGVGVIALSRRPAESIVQQAQGLDLPTGQGGRVGEEIEHSGEPMVLSGVQLPLDRLLLGVGSGAGGPGALDRVRQGVAILRSQLDTRIYISALGPRMSRLAGEVADGVLFNWLTPEYAEEATEWVREGAEQAGRHTPEICAYFRVALGAEAGARLTQEAARYSTVPSYSDHFRRMGVPAQNTGLVANTREEVHEALARWEGRVDEVVVRAITAHDTLDETIDLVTAASPLP